MPGRKLLSSDDWSGQVFTRCPRDEAQFAIGSALLSFAVAYQHPICGVYRFPHWMRELDALTSPTILATRTFSPASVRSVHCARTGVRLESMFWRPRGPGSKIARASAPFSGFAIYYVQGLGHRPRLDANGFPNGHLLWWIPIASNMVLRGHAPCSNRGTLAEVLCLWQCCHPPMIRSSNDSRIKLTGTTTRAHSRRDISIS